jgi:hypothetical protein|tara:strand:- start:205 stop:405 length:201 start_codon:yes stop_codon:yes gene_type:complete
MTNKTYECDYYMGENISQGLAEAKHCINQLIPKEEQSDYHEEIFNAIDEAIRLLDMKEMKNLLGEF